MAIRSLVIVSQSQSRPALPAGTDHLVVRLAGQALLTGQ